MHRSYFIQIIATFLLAAIFPASQLRADALPSDHPSAALAKLYFKHVVDEDWTAAALMLSPSSLERKKVRALELIKKAPTMSAEAEVLTQFGAKDIRELENMTPAQFYSAERKGMAPRDEKSEALRKQKQGSLKVDVVGVIGEKDKKDTVVHLAVRTSQNVLEKRIEELIFMSFQQDAADKTKWFIVPDMQAPVTTPLADVPAAETAAPKEPKKAEK